MKKNKCKIYNFYTLPLFIILFFANSTIAQKRLASESEQLVPTTKDNSNSLLPSSVDTYTGICTNSSHVYKTKYNQQSFYIPSEKDPVITLKITIHVFKPIADTGRWQMNDNNFNGLPALKYMLDSVTNDHQERYSMERRATYEVKNFNSPYIYDSKIRYEITNIYFYSDNDLYALNNDLTLFQHIEKTDPNRINEGMPIVFNASNSPGHLSSYKGAAALVTTIHAYDIIFSRSHLLHEIGHAFGLGHTYINTLGSGSEFQNFYGACGAKDYLSDVFPNNNPACQHENAATTKPENAPCFSCYESSPDTSNNVMGGQRYNRWMSPLQMGRRIRSMHLNSNEGRNIRQFAKDIESDHNNVWTISTNEVWDFDIQLYKDILVKSGVTLTIKCKTALAIEGKIKLEKDAKLIVDGGEITTWCKTGLWRGIEKPSKKKKKDGSVEPILIQLINGGEIKNSKMKIPTN